MRGEWEKRNLRTKNREGGVSWRKKVGTEQKEGEKNERKRREGEGRVRTELIQAFIFLILFLLCSISLYIDL